MIQTGSSNACNFAAEHLKSLAKQLCRLGPRQLQTVSPILEAEPDIVEAISTAKGIDATNQVGSHSQSVVYTLQSHGLLYCVLLEASSQA